MVTKTEAPGKETLIAVANRLFLEEGYAGVSMQQIAEAANMTKGAPYYHFKNKDDLFVTCFVREMERLHAGMVERLNRPGSLRDRLKISVQYVLESTAGDFNQMLSDCERYFKYNPENVQLIEQRADISRILVPYFDEGRAAGEFSRLEPEQATESLLMLIFGQMKFMNFDESRPERYRPVEDRASDLVDLLFDGI